MKIGIGRDECGLLCGPCSPLDTYAEVTTRLSRLWLWRYRRTVRRYWRMQERLETEYRRAQLVKRLVVKTELILINK